MALSSMFGDFAGAAGDIFGGIEKNKGLQIQADGTRITADGTRITAEGTRLKAQGDLVEATNYDQASTLAHQNEQFTEQSTAVKELQTQRQIYQGLGATRADVAGSGFAMSGSGLDILRMGAQEGALTKQVVGQQGLITEAGFNEQAQAYTNLAGYARYSSSVETDIAGKQDELANRQDELAQKQDDLGSFAQTAGEVTGALKGIAGIASLFKL